MVNEERIKDAIQIVLNIRVLKALRAIQILQDLGIEGKIKVKPKLNNQWKKDIEFISEMETQLL